MSGMCEWCVYMVCGVCEQCVYGVGMCVYVYDVCVWHVSVCVCGINACGVCVCVPNSSPAPFLPAEPSLSCSLHSPYPLPYAALDLSCARKENNHT